MVFCLLRQADMPVAPMALHFVYGPEVDGLVELEPKTESRREGGEQRISLLIRGSRCATRR